MDYEKKYKDALERARNIRFDDPTSATANVVCEEIFPELKESESEKIRKDIIAYWRYERKSSKEEIENRFIPWLEKQGEQKPAWSEEDEKYCRYIIDFYLQKSYGATAMAIEWLENLKNRVQPHWKPTDGQMQALELVVQYHTFADQDKREKIVALLNDLKNFEI